MFNWVTLSSCQDSVPNGLPRDILESEARLAAKILNLPKGNLSILDFVVREFSAERQKILQTFYDLNKSLKPDLVILPALQDLHQDHATVSIEGLRAFKNSSVLAYEIPWNNLNFQTTLFVSLEERHVNQKLKALASYESQSHRPYMNSEFLKSQLIFRGTQAGAKFAEAFEVLRWNV